MSDASFHFSVAADGCTLVGDSIGRTDRPTLLLLHPIGFDGRFWADVVPHLADTFRLVVPDARGHGQSGRGAGETSVEQLADDAIAILNALNVGAAAVAGCSMGSATAMRLGAAHPHRFDWLLLANAPARIPLPRERFEQGIAAARGGAYPAMARDMMQRWLAPGTEQERPDWVAARLADMQETSGDGFADSFAALRDSDRHADLGQISAPALVIAGEHDEAFSVADARAMAQVMAHGSFAVIPDAGHLAPLEQPQAFAAALLDFDDRAAAPA